MAPVVSPPEALIDDRQPLLPEPARGLVTTREIVVAGRVLLGEPAPHGASSTVPPGGIRPGTRATHSPLHVPRMPLIVIGSRLGVVGGGKRRPAFSQPLLPLHTAP